MNSLAPHLPAYARAALVTLAYTDQFSFPLSFDELTRRLLRVEISDAVLDEKKLREALDLLEEKELIEHAKSEETTFYFLHGRREILALRRKSSRLALQKVPEIDRAVLLLRKIPWLKAIFLTGSQAMLSADQHSDIDFMLVTSPRRLWISRILVSCIAQMQGKRRSWNNEEPGSWCFNLWLDTEHLQVHSSKKDWYRAHEVMQAKLLWSDSGVGEQFVKENSWINRYFFDEKNKQKIAPSGVAAARPGIDLIGVVDWLAWQLQRLYMRRHQTTEKVGRGFAFFHPRDTGALITSGWRTSLERCLPKTTVTAILAPYTCR